MKTLALALCAALAFGTGAAISAQGQVPPAAASSSGGASAGVQASGSAGGALGNATAVDETALVLAPEGAATPGGQAAAVAGPSTLVYFLRMILVLALVLGAMYLVFRLLRRVARPVREDETPILLLASKSLGSGRAVHLLGLGGRAWLVGATDQSVSLIAEVEDKELLDGLTLKASTEAPRPRGEFSDILAGLLGKGKKPGHRTASGAGLFDPGYLSRQRDRLKKYREPGQ